MGRRLLFILGLMSSAYGAWLFHHESVLNTRCNASIANPTRGITVSSQCMNVVWPYAEGFGLIILGAVLVLAGLTWSRRAMAGERQYMKDLKAGKYSRENDHLNAYNFNTKIPTVSLIGNGRQGLFDRDGDGYS